MRTPRHAKPRIVAERSVVALGRPSVLHQGPLHQEMITRQGLEDMIVVIKMITTTEDHVALSLRIKMDAMVLEGAAAAADITVVVATVMMVGSAAMVVEADKHTGHCRTYTGPCRTHTGRCGTYLDDAIVGHPQEMFEACSFNIQNDIVRVAKVARDERSIALIQGVE